MEKVTPTQVQEYLCQKKNIIPEEPTDLLIPKRCTDQQQLEKKLIEKTEKTIKVERSECKRIFNEKKASLSRKTEKTYTVTVKYIQVTDEEAKMKRAIIESILKSV